MPPAQQTRPGAGQAQGNGNTNYHLARAPSLLLAAVCKDGRVDGRYAVLQTSQRESLWYTYARVDLKLRLHLTCTGQSPIAARITIQVVPPPFQSTRPTVSSTDGKAGAALSHNLAEKHTDNIHTGVGKVNRTGKRKNTSPQAALIAGAHPF